MGEVLTGAIAIIKSNGKVIGKLKSWRASEDITRGDVQGIGTIYSSEVPVLKYKGTLSCSQMSVSYKDGVIPNAIKRGIGTKASQALSSKNASFEDNLVLEDDGLIIECYKKIKDVVDPATGFIKPKVEPYVIISKAFITSSGLDVSEAAISGHDQSFVFLDPIIYP
jgi:hypothetical protein